MKKVAWLPALFIALTLFSADRRAWPESSASSEKKAWVMPLLREGKAAYPCRVAVWFDPQLLQDAAAFERKKAEFAGWRRSDMRRRVVADLKRLNDDAWLRARAGVESLAAAKKIDQVRRHWIINGFSCRVNNADGLTGLTALPGVSHVFARVDDRPSGRPAGRPVFYPAIDLPAFGPDSLSVPWYIQDLAVDRVWREFAIFGQHTLTVVHDTNFIMTAALAAGLFRNPGETPANGLDDDANGRVDDVHGFNFDFDNADLTPLGTSGIKDAPGPGLHGSLCASLICGREVGGLPGVAPRSHWAGVVGHGRIEEAVEWAVEMDADVYNMSFSLPGLGQYRSYWRKVMEQGTLCGLVFVSGAGNFARPGAENYAPVPVQMRIPEDIPEAVMAVAGVGRDLIRPPFSSQGPVQWLTDDYREGTVPKPDLAAFNVGLPVMMPDGPEGPRNVSGNSFAGALLSGAAALILSADPELLPWELREILIRTARDVGPPGFDYQTGHGLIDCYRAAQEALRRREAGVGE